MGIVNNMRSFIKSHKFDLCLKFDSKSKRQNKRRGFIFELYYNYYKKEKKYTIYILKRLCKIIFK